MEPRNGQTERPLTELVNTFRALHAQLEAARLLDAQAAEGVKAHKLAGQYESLDSYEAARAALDRAENRAAQMHEAWATVRDAWTTAEKALMARLPRGIWIRFGDVGAGVAFSDWGGNHYYVVVQPWQAEMPSLDHTYRGS